MSDFVRDQVKELLPKLTLSEKAEVVALLGSAMKADLPNPTLKSRRSARGLCADLRVSISAEEIDEVRGKMWSDFPRGDI